MKDFIYPSDLPSPPRHLGFALPGSGVPGKGLPKAAQAPLIGALEAGSRPAGDEAGAPSPQSQPVRRGQGFKPFKKFMELDHWLRQKIYGEH